MKATQANDVTLIVEGDPKYKAQYAASGVYHCPKCGERIIVDDQLGAYEIERAFGWMLVVTRRVKPGGLYRLARNDEALECSTCTGARWRFEG